MFNNHTIACNSNANPSSQTANTKQHVNICIELSTGSYLHQKDDAVCRSYRQSESGFATPESCEPPVVRV
jgi:hypothetical protein